MDEEKTVVLNMQWNEQESKSYKTTNPVVFITNGRTISEYPLAGHQEFGRLTKTDPPDIAVMNPYVSRRHGLFDTNETSTVFTCVKTTNQIQYKGRFLNIGETVTLHDGDELIIPSHTEVDDKGVMLVYADSVTRIKLWRELQKAAVDQLTGLYNRQSFILWWQQRYIDHDYRQAALFILDIDNFKQINDRSGHHTGDAVLKAVADCLKSSVRQEKQVCRWGGDEFVGIMPGSPQHINERLILLSTRIKTAAEKLGVLLTVSIGVADIHQAEDILNIDEMVKLADHALYSVKQNGKNNISIYQP